MSDINKLLGRVAEPETPEDRDEAWNEISAQLRRQHEQEGFLRYLIACAGHSSFDLKAHVPRIKRLLGYDKSISLDSSEKMEHLRQTILKAAPSLAVDGAYSERAQCVAAVVRLAGKMGLPVGVTPASPGEWACVYIETPEGQVAWHVAETDRHYFDGIPAFMGDTTQTYTTEEKYLRVRGWVDKMPEDLLEAAP